MFLFAEFVFVVYFSCKTKTKQDYKNWVELFVLEYGIFKIKPKKYKEATTRGILKKRCS